MYGGHFVIVVLRPSSSSSTPLIYYMNIVPISKYYNYYFKIYIRFCFCEVPTAPLCQYRAYNTYGMSISLMWM